ncbi:PfkB family carbohydrate kinase [Brevundimonas nasdae]|jgi:hypothetical protein|uniref:Nucleoside 2-deoxyribosyltransferase n=1 Tax=Brevundimonas nasdae TaxID=172043 RepID=A0ABX8THQ5_9CAUL|nr:PfkB family carbohydrate kinase [Brevundimonas nasdae]QYC09617.1 nucleoside 2-deoxyribosyltransferase [Brevundimonas nasdae]QYC15666.1 nucleoside 2-deoxyribosyltransferase [Brevundimonas nasdae]
MTTFAIVGGVYRERCVEPLWDAIYGSAGRALAATTQIAPGARLVSYVDSATATGAQALADDCGATFEGHPTPASVCFDYLHPLAAPRINPQPGTVTNEPITVSGDVVLRYGMLEGDAVVHAKKAIYDPQSSFGTQPFGANGSTAERLAIVLNKAEAKSMTGIEDPEIAAKSLLGDGVEVVVLKMGPLGALVMTANRVQRIPLYKSASVFKIGSGDVFSSTFAALWGVQGLDPFEAADIASRATAYYCENRSLPPPDPEALRQQSFEPLTPGKGTVYLAGPFFDIGQRWLVEEANDYLLEMGANVFSPVHEVGPGPADIVAPEDIKGLERSDVVFAILNGMDPGTIFEVGYAVKKGIPVVGLAQNVRLEDLKMMEGTGCEIHSDFASAIYRAIWALPA